MINIYEKCNCSGCHACKNICPKNCIEMKYDNEGFLYPKVTVSECIDCGLCEKVCPILSDNLVENIPTAYAAYNNNEEVRLNSSSGGMFYLIAKYIIDKNGVVFGAKFDEKFNVVHGCAETIEEAKEFMGSKYVQSKIGDAYKEAKRFLEDGKLVLFTGTPCQIGGLKAVLNKNYDNLICQDIVCHGVPSNKMWKRYVAFREESAGSYARRIAFRRKNEGWKQFSVSFIFQNDIEYCKNISQDIYMQMYLKNICLRPSCYNCHFKTLNRQSDITLADFWGVQNVLPEMDDDNGTSLVLVNTIKGETLFESISAYITIMKTDVKEALKSNSAACKSVLAHPKRTEFFQDIDVMSFDNICSKYGKGSFVLWAKRRAYSLMQK
ncbi:MAG: Coenzyme F420 hydrogenase/dehydrogenase, beta subunit C-terminal domain [Clostridia bacterium]